MHNLSRAFIYRNKSELDEFLKDNPLNEVLYDAYLEIKNERKRSFRDIIDVFNEVYYMCTRIKLTPYPELQIESYFEEVKSKMISIDMTYLVFSMVYVVFWLQPGRLKNIRLLRMLEKRLSSEYHMFYIFNGIVDDWTGNNVCPGVGEHFKSRTFKSNFTPSPEPVFILEQQNIIWELETNGYEQERIRMIVNLWSSKSEKMRILDIIENTFDKGGDAPF